MDDDVHDLIGEIYEAATAPQQWGAIIHKIRRATHSRHGMLWLGNPNVSVEEFSAHPGDFLAFEHSDLSLADFQEFVRTCQAPSVTEPYAQVARRVPLGQVVIGSQFVPIDQYKRSEFYHQVSRPLGVVHQLGSIMARRNGRIDAVSFYRPVEAPNYEPRDERLLAALLPHIVRALNLHKRLCVANGQSLFLQNSLDVLNKVIVLVDWNGKVIFFNAAARSFFERCDDLLVRRDRLHAKYHVDTLQLEHLTKRVTGANGQRPIGGAVAIRRADGGLPLLAVAAPLKGDNRATRGSGDSAAALLMVHDPNAQTPVPREVVAAVFGLTSMEGSLLLALGEGQTLRQYSDNHRVTYNTARTHLRNVFKKTNTSKQSDLVRLIGGVRHSLAERQV